MIESKMETEPLCKYCKVPLELAGCCSRDCYEKTCNPMDYVWSKVPPSPMVKMVSMGISLSKASMFNLR